ncbi:MAG: cold-shock protein [candidate division WOR-3 bacterium]
MTGTVKWFDAQKGYGFIAPDDGGREVFVHFGDLVCREYRPLEPGQRVQFETIETPRGPRALRVQPVETPDRV